MDKKQMKMDMKQMKLERLKKQSRSNPYPKGAMFYNSVAYIDGEEIYGGDITEQILEDIRFISETLPHGRCITIINEHDMKDSKPFIISCRGKLYKVGEGEFKLPYMLEKEKQEQKQWEKQGGKGGLAKLFG